MLPYANVGVILPSLASDPSLPPAPKFSSCHYIPYRRWRVAQLASVAGSEANLFG